jgi:DNA-directed RNA polymerase specialized sigma24 family protein
MKNFTQGDYAVNKNATGIVYRFAGQTVEVTLDDYLQENPDKTAADFAELKALSDADYYEIDRSDYRQTWKNTSLDTLDEDETVIFSTPSIEDEIFERRLKEAAYAKRVSVAARALDKLTEIQRRRYLLYHVQGMSYREIATLENANHKSVEESILAAEKKIHNFLSQPD